MTNSGMMIATTALLLPLIAAQPAVAADFSFSVPVELRDVNADVTRARVACEVSSAEGFTPGVPERIARGESDEAVLEEGNLTHIFNLSFDADEGKDPGVARSWGCLLYLKPSGGWALADESFAYPADTARPYRYIACGGWNDQGAPTQGECAKPGGGATGVMGGTAMMRGEAYGIRQPRPDLAVTDRRVEPLDGGRCGVDNPESGALSIPSNCGLRISAKIINEGSAPVPVTTTARIKIAHISDIPQGAALEEIPENPGYDTDFTIQPLLPGTMQRVETVFTFQSGRYEVWIMPDIYNDVEEEEDRNWDSQGLMNITAGN